MNLMENKQTTENQQIINREETNYLLQQERIVNYIGSALRNYIRDNYPEYAPIVMQETRKLKIRGQPSPQYNYSILSGQGDGFIRILRPATLVKVSSRTPQMSCISLTIHDKTLKKDPGLEALAVRLASDLNVCFEE
jgi:hypothetical protein